MGRMGFTDIRIYGNTELLQVRVKGCVLYLLESDGGGGFEADCPGLCVIIGLYHYYVEGRFGEDGG